MNKFRIINGFSVPTKILLKKLSKQIILAKIKSFVLNGKQHKTNKSNIILRKATGDDLQAYFKWVSDSLVRQNSVFTDPINIDNHRQWFFKKINSINTLMYIFEMNEYPFGQVRFDIENNIAIVDYSIDKKFRGKGFGSKILYLGIQEILSEGRIKYIRAIVKETNVPSIKIFIKLGFEFIENQVIDRVGYKKFSYKTKEAIKA